MPIGNPDPILKKVLLKKKTYNKADIRALIGTKIAEREYQTYNIALAANITSKDNGVIPPGTPLAAGESLYQTIITLPTRPSPRRVL